MHTCAATMLTKRIMPSHCQTNTSTLQPDASSVICVSRKYHAKRAERACPLSCACAKQATQLLWRSLRLSRDFFLISCGVQRTSSVSSFSVAMIMKTSSSSRVSDSQIRARLSVHVGIIAAVVVAVIGIAVALVVVLAMVDKMSEQVAVLRVGAGGGDDGSCAVRENVPAVWCICECITANVSVDDHDVMGGGVCGCWLVSFDIRTRGCCVVAACGCGCGCGSDEVAGWLRAMLTLLTWESGSMVLRGHVWSIRI